MMTISALEEAAQKLLSVDKIDVPLLDQVSHFFMSCLCFLQIFLHIKHSKTF